MTMMELTERLKKQYPNYFNEFDMQNLRDWIIKSDIDVEKLYECICNNHESRTFPSFKKIKEWYEGGHYGDRKPTDNIFNEIMDIGQAMTFNQIYYKIKSIRKVGNWYLREEIFTALFSDIYFTYETLKESGMHDNQVEVYLNKMNAKDKVLRGELVRVPSSCFKSKDIKPENRKEKLLPIKELF